MSDHLYIYTVYDHPTDIPNFFVVKRWLITNIGPVQDPDFILQDIDLEVLRDFLVRRGLTLLPRERADDPVIIENYI